MERFSTTGALMELPIASWVLFPGLGGAVMSNHIGRMGRSLFIFIAIGATAGCLLIWLFTSPFLVRWERIGPAPDGIVELQLDQNGTVYVNTSAGKTYSLASEEDGRWMPDIIPHEMITRSEPCDGQKAAFS
jgi:hypothetical protein